MAETSKLVHSLGGELIYRDSRYSAVDVWVPVSQLSALAQSGVVATVSPVFKPSLNTRGIAPNQGDEAENADALRSVFGLDGSGVKVGVLSDSVNAFEHGLADSVATKDLPKGVEVIQDLILDKDVPEAAHRKHLLGMTDFYAKCTDIGIGFARNPKSKYRSYVSITIARNK